MTEQEARDDEREASWRERIAAALMDHRFGTARNAWRPEPHLEMVRADPNYILCRTALAEADALIGSGVLGPDPSHEIPDTGPWDDARIREGFIWDGGEAEWHDPIDGAREQRRIAGAIFDRWLEAHDAALLARKHPEPEITEAPDLEDPAVVYDLVNEHVTLPGVIEHARRQAEWCCEKGCGTGACESCPCRAAGWCVSGNDGIPDESEGFDQWLEVASEHNPLAARLLTALLVPVGKGEPSDG